MSDYRQYTGGSGSVLTLLTSGHGDMVISILILLGLAIAAWRVRHQPADTIPFALTSSLVLSATLVIIPMTAPYNQLLLLPAIFLLVRNRMFFSTGHRAVRLAAAITSMAVFWPWLVAFVLTLAALLLPSTTIQKAWAVPLWTSLAIPPLITVLLVALLIPHSSDNFMPESGISAPTRQDPP
jgi:hypothetical protein